jgi:hypothetical protein
MIDETDGVLEDNEAAKGLTDKFKISIEHRESTRKNRLNKSFNRLKENATLADNTKILKDDVWFRRNRSRVYIYLVPLISIFYFVPAIQFAFQVCFYQFSAFCDVICFDFLTSQFTNVTKVLNSKQNKTENPSSPYPRALY